MLKQGDGHNITAMQVPPNLREEASGPAVADQEAERRIVTLWKAFEADIADKLKACLAPLGVSFELKPCEISSVNVVVEKLPALARDFNVALATNNAPAAQPALLDTGLDPRLIQGAIQFARYGRTLWVANRQPKGVSEFWCVSHQDEAMVRTVGRSVGATFLKSLRQLLGLYARLTRGDILTDERIVNDALEKFRCRMTLDIDPVIDRDRWATIGRVLFEGFRSDVWLRDPSGGCANFHHGPGAVSERWSQTQKEMAFCLIDDEYEGLFWEAVARPLFVNVNPYWREAMKRVPRDCSLVHLVPKDYRGPRIIAAEPALHLFIQEGFKDAFVDHLHRHPATNLAIDLRDQAKNGSLALRGSKSGHVATLDLSDASDTVRIKHVQAVFRDCPVLLHDLLRLRTKRVCLEGSGEILDLTSFAPMGSALCFPMEALVYYVCIVSALWPDVMGSRTNISTRTLREFVTRAVLRCYGDDITIRTDLAPRAIESLEKAGFVPNRHKCCIVGHFRESCGVDACFGYDVTPFRPRNLPGKGRFGRGEPTLEQLIGTANNLTDYPRCQAFLLDIAEALARMPIPVIPEGLDIDLPGCVKSSFLYNLGIPLHVGMLDGNEARYEYPTTVYKTYGWNTQRALRDSLTRERVSEQPFRGYPDLRTGSIKRRRATTLGHVRPVKVPRDVLRALLGTLQERQS